MEENIQRSRECHLRIFWYSASLTEYLIFQGSQDTLVPKQKDQKKKQGKGAVPNTDGPIDDDEIEVLFKSGQLATSSPDNTMWWKNTTNFCLRAVTEHYNLCWAEIELKTNILGTEYFELVYERQTKTRTGLDARNVRKLESKMYATGDERCPVQDIAHLMAYMKGQR